MSRILIHRHAPILSAYGIAQADVVREAQEPCSQVYGRDVLPHLRERLAVLRDQCIAQLAASGFPADRIKADCTTNRFLGAETDQRGCVPLDPKQPS